MPTRGTRAGLGTILLQSAALPAQLPCGDCNGDALVATITDALTAAQVGVGLVRPGAGQACACDVDDNASITILDALIMAQRSAGLPVTLRCPAPPCVLPGVAVWEPAGHAAGGLFPTIIVDPVTPSTVYVGSDVSGVYRSDDRGELWQPMSRGLQSLAIASLVIDPADHLRLWAATPLGLHRNDDSGDTWLQLPSQPGTGTTGEPFIVECLEVDPADPSRLLAGTYWDGLWYSSDTGATWQYARESSVDLDGIRVLDLLSPTAGVVLAATDTAVIRSLDGGMNYTVVLGPGLGLGTYEYSTSPAANPGDPSELFAGTAKEFPSYHNLGSVWRSTDSGATWTDLTADLVFRRVLALAYDGGFVYAATEGASVYRRAVP